MTPQQVFDHFGGKAETARQLEISYQAVDKWEAKNEVPRGRQFEIQHITDGKLQATNQAA